jgi:hypothetical protein
MEGWLIFVPDHEPYDWTDHLIFYRTMAAAPDWHGDNIKDYIGHCGQEGLRMGMGNHEMRHGLYGGSKK